MASRTIVLLALVGCSMAAPANYDFPLMPSVMPFPHSKNFKQPGPVWGEQQTRSHANHHPPTNQWWTNLVESDGVSPVFPYPYLVRAKKDQVDFSYPQQTTYDDIAQYGDQGHEWSLEFGSPVSNHGIQSWDDDAVTYQWTTSTGGSTKAPLVKGAPYLTWEINNTPVALTTPHAIVEYSISEEGKCVVSLNSGKKWVLYPGDQECPEQVKQTEGGRLEFKSFDGVLRVAFVPNDSAEPILDQHKGRYPTGVTVDLHPRSSTIEYRFTSKGTNDTPLLMLSLPHHQGLLQSGELELGLQGYACTKGRMTAVLGERWELRIPRMEVSWETENPVPETHHKELLKLLKQDLASSKPDMQNHLYEFGKEVARVARLALIADQLNKPKLKKQAIRILIDALQPWLRAKNARPLNYDLTWHGICSVPGMCEPPSTGLNHEDYGNGHYNDHHYHYGYLVYAMAVVGRFEPGFLTHYHKQATALVHDYANYQRDSDLFPFMRAFDFYDMHSWAAGMKPSQDGKDMESSSESLNAYYAMYLMGLALGDDDMAAHGQLILSAEAVAVKKYWFMPESSDVYLEPFKAKKVVGIMFNNKATHEIWWGGNRPEFIHAIQWLPFTPVTRHILDPAYISEIMPTLDRVAADQSTNQKFLPFIYMTMAVVKPQYALGKIKQQNEYDSGNSQTNAYHWAVTQAAHTDGQTVN